MQPGTPTNGEIPKVIGGVYPIRHTFLVPNQIQSLGIPSMESNPQYFPPKLKQHNVFARLSNPLHTYASTNVYILTHICMRIHTLALTHKGRRPFTQCTHIPTQHTCAHGPSCTYQIMCVHVYVPVCLYTHINTQAHICTTQQLSKTASEQGLLYA